MNTEIGRRQALLAIAGGALGARTGFRPRFTENPDPLAGGGMKPEPVSVNWRLAADEKMTKIIRQGTTVAVDKWDGYPAARERLISFLAQAKPSNPVVISGDNHNNWVFDVKRDFANEKSPIIASEFVGTSITSGGDGAERSAEHAPAIEANPHLKFHNSQRGYVRCVIKEKSWQSDFRIVPYVSRQGAPIETKASFIVESGKPGASRI